jgi:hypothetical protein
VANPELRANALSKNRNVIRNVLFTLISWESKLSAACCQAMCE